MLGFLHGSGPFDPLLALAIKVFDNQLGLAVALPRLDSMELVQGLDLFVALAEGSVIV